MDRDVQQRIQRLATTADELRRGKGFSVTRLTVIKSLCRSREDAAAFVLRLATLSLGELQGRGRTGRAGSITARAQALASVAVTRMRQHLASPSADTAARLRESLGEVEAVQNTWEPVAFGAVRIIDNMQLLVVELALRCLLAPGEQEAAHHAYQAARHFAERYDSRFPDSLVPRSASRVEEMADFWCRRHLGQPLADWRKHDDGAQRRRTPRVHPLPRRPTRRSEAYPAIARWVARDGWIEVGACEGSSSFVRALDPGGLVWEGAPSYPSLSEALQALDEALGLWLRENG